MKETKHVRTQAANPMDGDVVLAHYRQCRGHGRGEYVDNVAYHLMRMILEGEEFDSLESLIRFCHIPENLGRWLPEEADRIVFSSALVQGLREMPLCPWTR